MWSQRSRRAPRRAAYYQEYDDDADYYDDRDDYPPPARGQQRPPRRAYRSYPPRISAADVTPEEEFGGRILDAVGVVRDRGGDEEEDEYDPYRDYPEPPDDEWEQQEPHQQRELLSDFVRRADPRAHQEWDPEEGYMVDFGDEGEEEGGDQDKASFIDTDRMAQNMDGLFDLDAATDPEIQRAREYNSQSLFRIPGSVAEVLYRRFKNSEKRAIFAEQAKADGHSWLVPSLSARQWASDRARIARVFDVHTRVRDMQRAMAFYTLQPETLQQLSSCIRVATKSGRRQYADYMQDLEHRIHRWIKEKQAAAASKTIAQADVRFADTPPRTSPATAMDRRNYQRVATRRRVGRMVAGGRLNPVPRQRDDRVSALDVPVLSRVFWVMAPAPPKQDYDGEGALPDQPGEDAKAAKSQYYGRGNSHFLSTRLGLTSAASRLSAEQDAVRFFANRFGLDFSSKAGGKKDVKTGAITHASLPAVLEPYTVSGSLDAFVQMAEGHLASASTKKTDRLGNGVRFYAREGDSERTLVAEIGWMVRTTSKEGLVLPTKKPGPKTVKSTRILPRGGILATGYWVIERPDAPPSLLRFQSSGPPTVTTQVLKAAKDSGVRHEITSRWDVYDTAHDAGARPYKGTGRGVSVIRIDRWRQGRSTQASRSMVTIHH